MFLRIAGAQSAEQSGIKGVRRPFAPDIMPLVQTGHPPARLDCRCEAWQKSSQLKNNLLFLKNSI